MLVTPRNSGGIKKVDQWGRCDACKYLVLHLKWPPILHFLCHVYTNTILFSRSPLPGRAKIIFSTTPPHPHYPPLSLSPLPAARREGHPSPTAPSLLTFSLKPPIPLSLSSSFPLWLMGNCCSGEAADAPDNKAAAEQNAEGSASHNDGGASGSVHNKDNPPTKTTPPNASPGHSVKPTPIGPVLGRPMSDVRTNYTIGKELGRGQFGVTHLCTDKQTGEQFACKTIAKRKLVNKEDIEDVRREVQIMHHLTGQPNIVQLKGAYEDKHSVHLVMELCAGGELFDRIIARGHYTERAAASLLRTIVQIVHTCHSMGVIHRDLKPENFLLLSKDEDAPLKATDFGLSVFYKQGRLITLAAFYIHMSLSLSKNFTSLLNSFQKPKFM